MIDIIVLEKIVFCVICIVKKRYYLKMKLVFRKIEKLAYIKKCDIWFYEMFL